MAAKQGSLPHCPKMKTDWKDNVLDVLWNLLSKSAETRFWFWLTVHVKSMVAERCCQKLHNAQTGDDAEV